MNHTKPKSQQPPEYDYLKAASCQDCTGLIPRGITEDHEIENYEELYPFLPKTSRPDDLSSEPE